jgi:SAM-dependent methyltransferase
MNDATSPPAWSRGAPLPDSYWLTGSSLDPTGRAFYHKGEIYRLVRASAVERVRNMFAMGIVSELVDRGLLIASEITDIPAPDGGIILRHETVPFLTAGHEWTRPQLKDAALAWLDLNLALAKHGLTTVDAQPANFGQVGRCQSTWIDFGSISTLEFGDQTILPFRRFYTNPLRLAQRSRGLSRLARAINQTGGIDDYELGSLTFAASPIAGRQMQNAYDRVCSKFRNWRKKMGMQPWSRDPRNREKVLQRERDTISGMTFPDMTTEWGNYQKSHLFEEQASLAEEPRRAAILQTIERVNPKRVIDLASNAGLYSFFAARRGAKVLAMDLDEKAIERLYAYARSQNEKISIAAVCGDVTRPSFERLNLPREADLVLSLALTHHLMLRQGHSIPYVVELLTRYTSNALLVEFMPNGLGCTVPLPAPLPDWYKIEPFEAELRTRFEKVSVVAEFKLPAWRVLYLAEGKR